jgi:16S rRNA (guanine1516-N2)-methyltransferase
MNGAERNLHRSTVFIDGLRWTQPLLHSRRVAYELNNPLRPSNSIAVCCAFPLLKRNVEQLLQSEGLDEDEDESEFSDNEHSEDENAAEDEGKEHEEDEEIVVEPTQTQPVPPSVEEWEQMKEHTRRKAERLAQELGLPFFAEQTAATLARQYEFLVEVSPTHVQVTQSKQQGSSKRKAPVYVDFVNGPLSYRAKFGNDQRSPMARAVGIGKKEPQLSVVDATGGLGKDAFVLASLGCRVTIVERNPVVHALLRDGLQRLHEANGGKNMNGTLELVHADSKQYLLSLPAEERPDVIYIDPMYPHPKRRQKALTKIGMQLARALVGDDADANQLLEVAQQVARKRVVIKRPKYVVEDPRASRSYKSLRTRFEVHTSSTM